MTPARTRLAHTPYLDAWRESLRAATDGPGMKAELARFLAAQRGQSLQSWKNVVGRILRGEIIPNGEDVLAISHWMASRTSENHTPAPRTGQANRRKRSYT